MEKFADQMQALLGEKLNAYHGLTELFRQERRAIVDMDLAFIWEAVTLKKEIAGTIQGIRTAIVELLGAGGAGAVGVVGNKDHTENHAENHTEDRTIDVDSFSSAKLISILDLSNFDLPNRTKASVHSLVFAIEREKAEVARLAFENQNHVQERLKIIEGIVSNFIPEPDLKRYGSRGYATSSDRANSFISRAV